MHEYHTRLEEMLENRLELMAGERRRGNSLHVDARFESGAGLMLANLSKPSMKKSKKGKKKGKKAKKSKGGEKSTIDKSQKMS